MILDKPASKAYGKLVSANSEFEKFRIIERMKPELAKRVLIRYVMNQERINQNKNTTYLSD